MNNKILYFYAPDHGAPSGGVTMIYRLVHLLNKNNIEAYVLHKQRNFKFSHVKDVDLVRIKYLEDSVYFNPSDILIIPEPYVVGNEFVNMFDTRKMKCKRVVFNQNWAYTYGGFRNLNNPEFVRYQDFGITDVLYVSDCIKDYLDFSMNYDNTLKFHKVSCYISDNFSPIPLEVKTNQIVFMPRKNANNFQDIFSTLYPRDREIPFIMANNLSEEQVADLMRQSTIFLSLGYPEGFGLPALEAMKSGCIVIGYSGLGGLEYMVKEGHHQNCFLFPDGDIFNLSQKLYEIYSYLKHRPENQKYIDKHFNHVISNAIKTGNSFYIEQTEKQIIEFAKNI